MADKNYLGNDPGNEGDLSVAANYDPSGVPVATDNVFFTRDVTDDVTAGLTTFAAITLGKWIVEDGCSISFGTETSAVELGCTEFRYSGTGSIANFDLKASAIKPLIFKTIDPAPGRHGIYLKGTALTGLNVYNNADVGFAVLDSDSGTIASSSIISVAGANSLLRFGDSVTLTGTTIKLSAGQLITLSSIVDINIVEKGTLTLLRSAGTGDVNNWSGILNWDSDGTIANYTSGPQGELLNLNDFRTKTLTNKALLHAGSVIRDPHNSITFSAAFQIIEAALTDVTIDVGRDKTYTLS